MTSSAIRRVLRASVSGALLVTAHPSRSAALNTRSKFSVHNS